MNNNQINRRATKKIAQALGELNEQVVYVGGAVVSLYIDDSAAEDVRPTKDIDITLQIASWVELEQLREKLQTKGFTQSHEDDVMCRFRYEDIKVDVMSTQAVGWAPANPWFGPGFPHRYLENLEGVDIYLLPLPYFLATKFVAFYDRGSADPRTSHDFEDIVYLLNYTSNLKDQIFGTEDEVRTYLIKCFEDILGSDLLQEAILGHLFYQEQDVSYSKIMDTLKEIVYGLQ